MLWTGGPAAALLLVGDMPTLISGEVNIPIFHIKDVALSQCSICLTWRRWMDLIEVGSMKAVAGAAEVPMRQ